MFPRASLHFSCGVTTQALSINILPWDATISCLCVVSCSIISIPSTNSLIIHLFIHVTTVLPKMRIPKAKNIFKSIQYHDIDDYLYVLYYYGKAMTWSPQWKSRPRTDLILWDVDSSTKELVNDFKIDNTNWSHSSPLNPQYYLW